MKNLTDEQKVWLQSDGARRLRAEYSTKAKVQITALISAAYESTDPKVRGIATSYATWLEALKDLEIPNDAD